MKPVPKSTKSRLLKFSFCNVTLIKKIERITSSLYKMFADKCGQTSGDVSTPKNNKYVPFDPCLILKNKGQKKMILSELLLIQDSSFLRPLYHTTFFHISNGISFPQMRFYTEKCIERKSFFI